MKRRENTLNKKKPEFEKAGLKLNIEKKKKKTKIMASGPITSWQIDGEKVEAVTAFLFWALKSLRMELAAIKLEDDCLLAGKLTNLDNVLKSKDITLPTKVHIVKAVAFLVVLYQCVS